MASAPSSLQLYGRQHPWPASRDGPLSVKRSRQGSCRRRDCLRGLCVANASADDGRSPDSAQVGRRGAILSTALTATTSLALGRDHAHAEELVPVTSESPLLVPKRTAFKGSEISAPSAVIKGCWQLSGYHKGDVTTDRTSAGGGAVEDFQKFVDAGITTFDTGPEACGYGPSELVIREFLQKRQAGIDVPVQVFTKVCAGFNGKTASAAYMEESVNRACTRLGVEALDLAQLYFHRYEIGFNAPTCVDAALYLQDLQAKGKIRAIGATNFDTEHLAMMTDAGVNVVNNQVQFSLLDRRPLLEMQDYCVSNQIGITPYGVVAGGFLTNKYLGVEPGQVAVDTSSKSKYASVLNQVGGYQWYQDLLQALGLIADKHNQTIANVATRWVLQQPAVPAVIIGARNANHVPDHQRLFLFELDGEDLAMIDEVLARGKEPQGDCYSWERGQGKF